MPKRFQGHNANVGLLNDTDRDNYLPLLKRTNAMSHTLMDHWAFTVRASEAMPDTLFGHRSWNPFGTSDDTKTYLHHDPEKFAKWLHTFPKLPNGFHHLLNEPTSDNVPYLVDWLIEAMELTGKNGKYPTRCIVGNLAVDKSFQHQGDHIRWQDDWLRFFRAFEKHIDWHVLGIHRYWMADVRLAYVGNYPANIRLDHPQHKDYLDSSKHKLRLERLPNGDLPPHWTGYADLWVKLLLIENSIQIPKEMETEGIHDEKRDPGSNPFNTYVDTNYPTGYNGGNARGTFTWEKWSEASSGLSYVEQLEAQLIARNNIHMQLERDYPQLRGKQLGAHWFSYTKAPDWTKAGFSLYYDPDAPALLDKMATVPYFEVESTPMPTPDDPYKDVMMYPHMVHTTIDGWNIRALPTTASEDVGDMPSTPTSAMLSKEVVESDSRWDWYKIWIGDTYGFVAQYRNESTPNVFTPIENDVPDETEPPTPEQWQALIDEISEVKQKFASLEQDVADMKSQFELIHVDIPIPNFTLSLPRFMVPYVVTKHRGNAGLEEAIAQRTESGTPTLSQIANEIYSTATVEPSLNTHTNVSDLGSDMILDDMMNPSAEDDVA